VMIQFVSGYDIAVEAKMIRSAFANTILLVEGDDDIRFLDQFVSANECILLPARGKGNVLTAIGLLEDESFDGALGIVDADYWHIFPPDDISDNICVTDYHDIEIMAIESNALLNILYEYGSQKKIERFVANSSYADIREAIYEKAFHIGVLRLAALKSKLQLKFEGMRYDRIVNRDTLEVDTDRLISSILQVSNCKLTNTHLRAAFDQECLEQKEIDRCQLCSGDDVISIICIGLRKALGTQNAKIASRSNIESALRLAYDSTYLKNTNLYRCVKQWETDNPPYVVFNI
jgi:hypothetical protein